MFLCDDSLLTRGPILRSKQGNSQIKKTIS
jgi:hypothetical protein